MLWEIGDVIIYNDSRNSVLGNKFVQFMNQLDSDLSLLEW